MGLRYVIQFRSSGAKHCEEGRNYGNGRGESTSGTHIEQAASRRNIKSPRLRGTFDPVILVAFLLKTSPKAIARQVMAEKAWAYYSSAADDEITNRENHAAYHRHTLFIYFSRLFSNFTHFLRLWFRPQILVDVTKVDWSTTILGHRSSMPVYIVSTE